MKQRYLALAIAAIGLSTSAAAFAQNAQVVQAAQSAFQVSNNQSIGETLKNYKSLAPSVLQPGQQPNDAKTGAASSNGSQNSAGTINQGTTNQGATQSGGMFGGNGTNNPGSFAGGGGSVSNGMGTVGNGNMQASPIGGFAGGVLNNSNPGGNMGGISNGTIAGNTGSDGFSLDNLARAGQLIGGVVGGKAGVVAAGLGSAVGTYNNCGGITSGEGVTVNCALNMTTTAASIYAATHQDSQSAQNASRVLGVVTGSGLVSNLTGMQNDRYIGETDEQYKQRTQMPIRTTNTAGNPQGTTYPVIQVGSEAGPVNRTFYPVDYKPTSSVQWDELGNAKLDVPLGGGVPQFDAQGNPITYKPSTSATPVRATPGMSPVLTGTANTGSSTPAPGSAWDVPQKNTISVSTSNASNQALMQQQSDNIVAAQSFYRSQLATYGEGSPQARSALMAVNSLSAAYAQPGTSSPGSGTGW